MVRNHMTSLLALSEGPAKLPKTKHTKRCKKCNKLMTYYDEYGYVCVKCEDVSSAC